MVRLFHISLVLCSFVILIILFGCNSSEKNNENRVDKIKSSLTISTYFDTLCYDDGNLRPFVGEITVPDTMGVWFTPNRQVSCSLVAVQYVFGGNSSSVNQISGFVNAVPKYYDQGPELKNCGTLIDSFRITLQPNGGEHNIQLANPISAESDMDFFIGYVFINTPEATIIPISLADNDACFNPTRSYLTSTPFDTMFALSNDLGIRAIFKTVQDTGKYTIELQWKQPKTDLDLYLIFPISKDTVYWRHPSLRDSIKLDVDDNDGYGPEKITCPIITHPILDSLAQIGVHYYGPGKGKQVQARVIIKKNDVVIGTLGWCNLRPKEWWTVAWINLYDGDITAEKPCDVRPNPNLSMISKDG